MSRTLLLLAALSTASSLPAATGLKTTARLEAGREPVRIVCVGDSITGIYYHTGSRRAYPELLELALRRLYPRAELTVFNAGLSGDSTTGALVRLDRDVIARQPHLVTVMFGMNDVVKIPLADFQRNLREICARVRQAGAEVLLCTQNTVTETEARPSARLAEYTQAIRDLAREESIGLVDVHASFAALQAAQPEAWSLLSSDEIHPGMHGHRRFASAIAEAISGKAISLADVGPPTPSLPHTFARLREGKPVKVLAMPPLDQIIAPALRQIYPQAEVTVTSWPTDGRTMAQLEASAKEVRAQAMDLVLIAIPPQATAENPAKYQWHYNWIMNWSLNFGPPSWDVVALPPSTISPQLNADEQELDQLARVLIAGKDLPTLSRSSGDRAPLAALLATWLAAQPLTSP